MPLTLAVQKTVAACYLSNAAGWISDTAAASNGPLVLHLTALTDPDQVRALLNAARTELAARERSVLIVDGSATSGATFDAIWELEALILNLPEQVKEWRHVPCGSPALLLALRRMLRMLQSRNVTCGVYNTYAEAVAVCAPGTTDLTSTEPGFHGKAGSMHVLNGALVVDLATAGTEFDLAVLMDSVVHSASQPGGLPATAIIRIRPAAAFAMAYLAAQIGRVQRCGSGTIVVVADEAGLLNHQGAPAPHGLHVTKSFAEALAHLDMITMRAFRLAR